MKNNTTPLFITLFLLALLVNFWGINLGFFTDDPGLYASLAKNMLVHHRFWELYTYNQDWLDKPHFPFWVILGSFKLFGVSVWAYRLPALLFFLLSLLYTYLFSKRYYGKEIAFIAVLIVMTAQQALMSNTDVRAEPYLMGLIIGSIYHIAKLDGSFSLKHFLLAAILTACAVMTKGIFVFVAIYGALLGQLIFTKRFKAAFQLKWISLFLVTCVFILPEIYALYIQFDLHPEKVVFGKQNVSGIKWFLWDSQFGRFVNTGPIKRTSGDKFFFVHTLLWAFAPWCLAFYFATFKTIKRIFKRQKLTEYYTISGGMLLLLLFSFSGFQLPFYTNILFPLFAVWTANCCWHQLTGLERKILLGALWPYIILLPVAIILIDYVLKPGNTLYFIIDSAALSIVAALIFKGITTRQHRAVLLACASVLFANFYFNGVVYPEMISFNGQTVAARYINADVPVSTRIYTLRLENNVFQFYCDRPIAFIPLEDFKDFNSTTPSMFYANHKSVEYLKTNQVPFKVVKSFVNYPQESLLPGFIIKTSRSKVLDSVYLVTK